MLASSQAQPLLTGVSSVVAYADLLSTKGPDILLRAMNDAAEKELERLQKAMLAADDWVPLADKVRLNVTKGQLSYGMESRDARRSARAIEYGSITEVPQPVMRKHAKDSGERFMTVLNENLSKALGQ